MSKGRPNSKNPPALRVNGTLTEEELQHIESDPRFHKFMDDVDRAEREGRTISHEEVIRRMHRARAGRR
jgi:hypothetical protein